MHGRPRKPQTPEELLVSAQRADKLRSLQSQLLQFHHDKIFTNEALEISAKLLEMNPEYYTGWNYRKLAVQHFLHQQSVKEDTPESIQSIMDGELRVVENALRTNIKSYGAWHHRKWVLSKGHSSMDRELQLLRKFQKIDARNFHAWNYRRFVTGLMKIPNEEELKYVTGMIEDNFSNYSAWHNRSVLLSQLLEKGGKDNSDKEHVLQEEYDIVRHSFFTDPDDQSGWFYHLWLLDQTVTMGTQVLSSWPPHGSKLSISADHDSNDQISLPVSLLSTKSTVLPFVLYFSESVAGVSSSSVRVESKCLSDAELIWTPLSINKSDFAQAWSTYLSFPNDLHALEVFPVSVTVASCPSIISSNGTFCGQCHLSFTVHVPSLDLGNVEELNTNRISWEEENFCAYATQSPDAHLLHSISKLEISREKQKASEWNKNIIAKEIDYCRELLSLTECKIGKLTLARLLMANNTLISYGSPNDGSKVNFKEVLGLYDDLIKKDSAHICYYKDKRSVALLKQMTSNKESLLKFCHQYKGSRTPSMNSYSCLRLNGLSLSRIGSLECLLWVQMLDLSHNELRSIEGLEALQLLSCLNLSYNKICGFSALDVLKLLKLLKVLDISNNEIGSHSIDTRRYLFSSPLNHALGDDCLVGIDSKDHWDAFFIFKDLHLIQLDIIGNPVVDDQLKASIIRSMPTLKWFDGQSCD